MHPKLFPRRNRTMQQVFTAHQTKEYEGHLMKSAGVPSLLLMEHAAEAIASAVSAYSPKRVLTVAGYGNNGADGLAASRLLKAEGIISDILLIGDRTHASSEWKVQWDICKAAEIDFYTSVDDIRVAVMSYDLISDALL